jgi:hypothetical protein
MRYVAAIALFFSIPLSVVPSRVAPKEYTVRFSSDCWQHSSGTCDCLAACHTWGHPAEQQSSRGYNAEGQRIFEPLQDLVVGCPLGFPFRVQVQT